MTFEYEFRTCGRCCPLLVGKIDGIKMWKPYPRMLLIPLLFQWANQMKH